MNWKNTAENVLILLLGILIGVVIGYKVSVTTAEKMLDNQKALIEQAIQKNTTAINNTVTNEFSKIKSNKADPINIIIKPDSNSAIEVKNSIQDSIPEPEPKTGFFKRLFNGKSNKP
ncbi:hypothetical protein [Formosa sp. S-31]|uniref:hypothetical protein n=1 Tax=Formosa sp. S-31 TaxID=2790949 RepID=UPI003EBC9546